MSTIEQVGHQPGDRSKNTVADSAFLSLTSQDQDVVNGFIDRGWNSDFVSPDKTQDFCELVGQVESKKPWNIGNNSGKIDDSSDDGSGERSCSNQKRKKML